MDHVVYVDYKEKELERLIEGKQTMVIRGAAGRKIPYGRVHEGDTLYFINNNGEGVVKARGTVKAVINSDKMTKEESEALVNTHQNQLALSPKQYKRWAGKRYITLMEIEGIETIESAKIDRSQYGNMDDWLPVEKIENVIG